jgi:hypothetical protein
LPNTHAAFAEAQQQQRASFYLARIIVLAAANQN